MDLEAIKSWSQFGHPVLMWVVLGFTIYAGYQGVQIRRTRSADKDTKKKLLKKQFNLKHYQLGSILLALMVLGNIAGMGVTYINNGKLFVGPHLLAGLAMTGMMAMAAALVPWMQKGNDAARYAHITLNTIIVGLFGWQAVSGMEILQRIVSKL